MKVLYYIGFLVLLGFNLLGQVTVPDANFLNQLKTTYPQVIDANDKLIISEAAKITGVLDCHEKNIKSMEGVQYFTAISILDCNTNAISDLSYIANLHQLTKIYCVGNKLTKLPNLSNFPLLNRLSCDDNQITSLVGLEALLNLTYLSAGFNKLTTIEGLDQLTNVVFLSLSNNQLTQISDFSTMVSFKHIDLAHNKLREIGQIAQMTNLEYFAINKNELSFSGLKKIAAHPDLHASTTQFIFHQQRKTYAFPEEKIVKRAGVLSLACPSHFTATTNIYQWYFNDQIIGGANTAHLQLSNAAFNQSGGYKCTINNADPYLSSTEYVVIFSNVNVRCSITLAPKAIGKDFFDCNKGWELTIDKSGIEATTPVKYTLVNQNQELIKMQWDNRYTQLFEGYYLLKMTDESNCTLDTVVVKPTEPSCDEDLIFTPNGDGQHDTFYIDKKGEAIVYDRFGAVIKKIQLPGYWDGTNSTNTAVGDGYYIILINGEMTLQVAIKK